MEELKKLRKDLAKKNKGKKKNIVILQRAVRCFLARCKIRKLYRNQYLREFDIATNAYVYHQQPKPAGTKVKEFPSGDWLARRSDSTTTAGAYTDKDVFVQGDADDGFIALAAELGWLDDLAVFLDEMARDSADKLRTAIAAARKE